ncbi:hypothetical protein PVNG_02142 [Plasmodium vivax North Korean]|uniref:Uncharacterized protein n=1 Tax=Plasmodium vivax North Korean TaxID=1035514 RepID=A0A0J9TUL6_PLAVI|nr:hypothetical protein PVNG_02142 [Plasmodium vivax North Korean]
MIKSMIITYKMQSIWKLYEEFDKSVDKDDNKGAYNSFCDMVRGQAKVKEGMYNDFCTKLVRNLGPFADNSKPYRANPERCQILYHWVYYMTMKYDIPDNFIKKIFDDSNKTISVWNEKHVCPYYSYKEKIKEPPNIMKIFNFQFVMSDLVSILRQDNHKIAVLVGISFLNVLTYINV